MCNTCGNKDHTDLDADFWSGLEDGSFTDTDLMEQALLRGTPPVPATGAEFAERALSNSVAEKAGPATFEEPCPKCRGRGRFISYTGRDVGPCFHCKGEGKVYRKTSAEARETKAQQAKERHAAKVKAWMDAHPAEMEWMIAASGRGFNFAADMIAALAKYGDLNEFKLTKVREFMAKDAARAEEKVAIAARAPDITGASLDKIEQAFANAIGHGIKFPKMRLDAFIFSKVMSGQNAGAIYVKSIEKDDMGERRYLGKIVDGRFVRVHACSPDEQERIIAAAMDPAAAAKAYGQRTGTCSICGRELTRAESIDRAMGPICADRYGW